MSKMREVAKLLGVKVGREFKVIDPKCQGKYIALCAIAKSGDFLVLHSTVAKEGILESLLEGKFEVHNWPNSGDLYYYPDPTYTAGVAERNWTNNPMHTMIRERGGVYKTRSAAINAACALGWVKENPAPKWPDEWC